MWHEARRQERKIRGLMVDYKKRAERRRQYYERIKLDPTQFVRINGRSLKIHLEQSVALLAESPQSMMPWQGQTDNMIDRFDVRAHLDYIPEKNVSAPSPELTPDEAEEERQSNYERYRMIVQNECTGVTEDQCLRQIYIDEQFGAVEISKSNDDKKKNSDKKAAIGYTYEDSTSTDNKAEEEEQEQEEDAFSSDDEVDLDVAVDVDTLTDDQAKMLNQCAVQFGMKDGDYVESLKRDKEEAEAIKLAKLLEEEKAQFSGRKSRRERRAYKEKRLAGRAISPPSYAARESPKYEPFRRSPSSHSRSPSPENAGQVQFITSFGLNSDDENKADVLQGPSLPPPREAKEKAIKSNKSRRRSSSGSSHSSWSSLRRRKYRRGSSSSRSWTRSPARRRHRRSRSLSRSRSRSRDHLRRRHTRSRSRSGSRSHRRRSKSRSRSHSRSQVKNRDRSISKSRSRSLDRFRSGNKNIRSRSRSRSSRSFSSRSSSRSNRSRSHSHSKSRSRSMSIEKAPPVKRYRRPSLESNSESSDSNESEVSKNSQLSSSNSNKNGASKIAGLTGFPSKSKLTPQEKLKRRMQMALNKQYKADKRAQEEKVIKSEQLRMDREEELRMLAIQMRRREREKRHKEREDMDDTDAPAPPSDRSSRHPESSRWTSDHTSSKSNQPSESSHRSNRDSERSGRDSSRSYRSESSRSSMDSGRLRTRSRSRTREADQRYRGEGDQRYRGDTDHRHRGDSDPRHRADTDQRYRSDRREGYSRDDHGGGRRESHTSHTSHRQHDRNSDASQRRPYRSDQGRYRPSRPEGPRLVDY